MAVDAATLRALIDDDLLSVSDTRVLRLIRGKLVEPHLVLRDWDYGAPGQQYPCWIVLDAPDTATAIAYSEYGFGPRCPWGLISSDERHPSMGMDSGWFTRFLDAVFESVVVVGLPIWRVYQDGPGRAQIWLTDETDWEDAWAQQGKLQANDPSARYRVGHSIY